MYVCSCVSYRCLGTWYAQADWERDCEGNQELSKEQAYNAVFQLIDIWTASLDVAECVALSLAHRPSHAIDLACVCVLRYLALTNALYYRLTLGGTACVAYSVHTQRDGGLTHTHHDYRCGSKPH